MNHFTIINIWYNLFLISPFLPPLTTHSVHCVMSQRHDAVYELHLVSVVFLKWTESLSKPAKLFNAAGYQRDAQQTAKPPEQHDALQRALKQQAFTL